jgi:hypothetical protein
MEVTALADARRVSHDAKVNLDRHGRASIR